MIIKRFFKTKDEVEVTFELDVPPQASKVEIVADFLNWQPEPMKKVAKSSTFKFKTRLPKDAEFQFRYLLDAQEWVNDSHADQYIPNGFGEDNCLVKTSQ
ncbi:isoamylase early set domain-containing protein [Vibrio sp. Vb2880]|uniref:1,4-alpha-glucan branching protein n=1 Tax=Vibrio furnissii TaxID=29494 RepID=A0A0Q2SJL0_VIBFU|nr:MULTISPECIES: isoamylase early set domain-containing protein [Vibrio]MCE7626224.1 isoamylase early set domain-containing protein [Vibrio fluvialis]ADT89275.1 1,4-alpha-glucan branching enzyme [Vibrio furnissii NCTC 11218]EEX40157.1 1,4-alpha-glucan branching enzyme [Vibrio furnissii CIP 102972]KQH87787.1 1,4-alpha-glucan branching protein [Vibrio furnissii]MBO0213401.1 isoamylase early set domain-containing protein [Vibrio sp. Vb2880]